MGDLSEHFDRSELACPCGCGQDTVDYNLIEALELVRGYLNRRFQTPVHVTVTSGNRCHAHNIEAGGTPGSQHMLSKAADIQAFITSSGKQISPTAVYTYLDDIFHDRYGLGLYDQFVHIDVRKSKARWEAEQ